MSKSNGEDFMEEDESSNENEDDSNFSDSASFPTQEDLESIIVHPPESVPGDVEVRSVSSVDYGASSSHAYYSLRSLGSTGSTCRKERVGTSSTGGGSVGGGGSSIGSETKSNFAENDRKSSISGDYESHHHHPVTRVMVTAHALQYQYSDVDQDPERSFPILMSSTTETAKSDVATICSGSFTEDIDNASVGTNHSNTGGSVHTATATNFPATPSPFVEKMGRKKNERGVEFATETSMMWTRSVFSAHPLARVPQLASACGGMLGTSATYALPATSITLNDMGPPLKRSFLERSGSGASRPGSVKSFISSTGTTSRPSSVRSFGSQAASEVVHVDTDDCGGSIVESEGHLSGGGMDETNYLHDQDQVGDEQEAAIPAAFPTADEAKYKETQPQNVASLQDRLSVGHGRVSPGGTVYKGRGVRRYQGRYMHLPLKRFHQNGISAPLHIEGTVIGQNQQPCRDTPSPDHQREHWERRKRSWRRSRSRSRRRSRSRSRSRDRERSMSRSGNVNRASMKRSWSPPSRQSPHRSRDDRDFRGGNREMGNSVNGTNRWRNGSRGNSARRYRNNTRRGGGRHIGSRHNRGRQRSGGPDGNTMTPRDPRHRDCNWK